MTAIVVDGVDITALSDEEIFKRLNELGAVVGPIVDSTREVYRRKLYRLLTAGISELNLNKSQNQNHQAPVAAPVLANHVGILKGPEVGPRFRTGRRSVTMAPSSTSCPQPQRPEKKLETSVGVTRTPDNQYFICPTPRQGFFTGGTPTNTTPSSGFLKVNMTSTPLTPLTSYRETIQDNTVDGKKLTNGSQHVASSMKKTNQLFVNIFEAFMICFLVIVGYVFYQEIVSFNKAEKEFAQNS